MIYQFLPLTRDKLDTQQRILIEKLQQYLSLPERSIWDRVTEMFVKGRTCAGVYVHGGVGLGKSMICRAYFEAFPKFDDQKVFLHYRSLLRILHEAIHEVQQGKAVSDVVQHIASQMSYRLIVIDEFEVQDITDAMILYRLFQQWRKNGAFIVMTSNVPPSDLYQGGLQRERFLPFIDMLERHFDIIHVNSTHDYRMEKLLLSAQRIFYGNAATEKLDKALLTVIPQDILAPTSLTIFGRELELKTAGHGILVSSFAELCMQDLSYNDYLEICNKFNVVILKDTPLLNDERIDEVIRFIHLVDVIYMSGKMFFMSAASELDQIYSGSLRSAEWNRTCSRLVEMNSENYGVKI